MKTIKKIGNNGNNIGKNTSEKVTQALTNKKHKNISHITSKRVVYKDTNK